MSRASRGSAVSRRKFIAAAGATSTAAIASPAIAQSNPEIKWRMPLFVPKTVESVMGGVNDLVQRVSELSDGKFQLQPFGAGEIVPGGPAVLNAAETRHDGMRVHTVVLFIWQGSSLRVRFDTAVRVQPARPSVVAVEGWRTGALLNRVQQLQRHARIAMRQLDGPQMGGFFRKEINSLRISKG